MPIFESFLTRWIVIVAAFLYVPVILADINCSNTPIETALQGSDIPNIVKVNGDVKSLPFGADLRITVPTSLVNKSGTKILACIRWKFSAQQEKDTIEQSRNAIVAKTSLTLEKVKIAVEKTSAFFKAQSNETVTTAFKTAETSAKEAEDAAKSIDSFNKAIEALNKITKTAEATKNALQTLEKAVPKPVDEMTAPTSADSLAAVNNAVTAAKAAENLAEADIKILDPWTINLPLRVVETKSDITTINVRLPDNIKERMDGSNPYTSSGWWWPGANADVRFIVTDNKASVLDTLLDFQISSHVFAATVAVVSTAIFWAIFFYVARLLGLQGDFVLKVIANKQGRTSLSQFQIMLWTLVVGGSMLYVMVLSARLIDIQTTTLYLLGIAGFSMVLGKVQPSSTSGEVQKTSTQQAITLAEATLPPGAVTDLDVCGNPGEKQVLLSWKSPKGGGKPTQYVVKFKKSADPAWSTPVEVKESPYPVLGLDPQTAYDFQVIPKNNALEGPSTELKDKKTASSMPSQAPDKVDGVIQDEKQSKEDQIFLQWNSLNAKPDGYVVRYRLAGTSTWNIAGFVANTDSNYRIRNLIPNTDYECQVFGVKNGEIGAASLTAAGRTAQRTPRWSDLLEAECGGEIDVSRIQMLFFTLIAAIFVLLKVASSNEIPVIPEGILLLMGISNGIYLTAKFTPDNRK